MKSTIPVFVISLASSTDRRAGISERLKKLGTGFEVWGYSISELQDMADAIYPYNYHFVIERLLK